jgi:Tol biopolymer transport system component
MLPRILPLLFSCGVLTTYVMLLCDAVDAEGLPRGPQPATTVTIKETVLGTIHPGIRPQTLRIASLVERYAYVATANNKWFVVTTNGNGPSYDLIEQRTFQYLPDGLGAVYVARRGQDQLLVARVIETKIEGELIFSGFVPNPLVSADGRHFVVAVKQANKARAYLDAAAGPQYDDIVALAFRGAKLFYVAKQAGKYFAVVDGIEDGPFDNVSAPYLSSDGSRFAISVLQADGWHMRVDGIDGRAYAMLGAATFSPDGKRFAYVAEAAGGTVVVVDGTEIGPYRSISGPGVFSPDSKRHAFIASTDGNLLRVVLDRVPQENYQGITEMIFSPDSRRLAFVASQNAKAVVVLDGVPGKTFDNIEPETTRFSADSKQLAYVARTGQRHVLVRDGIELLKTTNLSPPIFSPDSSHLVFTATETTTQHIYVDANAYGNGALFDRPESVLRFVDQTRFRLLGQRANKFIQFEGTIPTVR